jgi:predicted deacetylase
VTAQYLLRFDDLCPTMDRAHWRRYAALIERFEIKPILAVVPDNRDPELMRDEPDPEFWDAMRRLEANGACVGVHGYRHVCISEGRSLVPLHGRSEFAGVAKETQTEWIRAGLGILRAHSLNPRIWVAPRHGFDDCTLEVLRAEGVELVSDGFAARPFEKSGLIWIPQQLWGPTKKRPGLWTICLHANTATDEEVTALNAFLSQYAAQFTSVDRVMAEWTIRPRSIGMRWFQLRALARIWLRRLRN